MNFIEKHRKKFLFTTWFILIAWFSFVGYTSYIIYKRNENFKNSYENAKLQCDIMRGRFYAHIKDNAEIDMSKGLVCIIDTLPNDSMTFKFDKKNNKWIFQ